MVKGIRFGELHSYEDLNLILSKVDLPPAAVKTVYVDNPGGDGQWDLTEANGKVNYKNRTAKFTFSVLPEDDFEAKKTEISNLLNGRRFKIVLDKDPEYFWDGRCSVDKYESNKKLRKIVVAASVAPYKVKNEKTRVFVPFCGTNLFDNSNFERIAGSSANLSTISTGVRADWVFGKFSFVVLKWLPIEMLLGKTITLSCNIAESGGGKGTVQIGYCSADGSTRDAIVKIEESGAVALTVEKTNPQFEYIALWFYANNGGTPSEGAYVDYTNVQIELGDTVSDRRNILPCPYPESTTTGEGVTFTTQADGGITATGTATGQKNFSLYYGDLLTDGVVTFSVSGNYSNLTAVFILRDEAKETLFNKNVSPSITVDLADYPTATIMEILVKRTVNAEVSGTIYPQLEKGTTVTEYTPYVPYEPYIPAVPQGKNIFNYKDFTDYTKRIYTESYTKESVEYLGEDCFSFALVRYSGNQEYFTDIPYKENTQYTVSFSVAFEGITGSNIPLFVFRYTDGSTGVPRFNITSANEFYECNFTSDPNKTLQGFIVSNSSSTQRAYIKKDMQIEVGTAATEHEPYSTDHDITLTNGRKTVSPTIVCTGETNVKVDDLEVVLGEGTHKVLGFSIEEGETAATLSGSGAAAIIYQEGDL